jgi:hypothetical protein
VQQRDAIQRLVQLVVNKLLHQPTIALREAPPEEASLRAELLCQLFDLSPIESSDAGAVVAAVVAAASSPSDEPRPALGRDLAEPAPSERKAVP